MPDYPQLEILEIRSRKHKVTVKYKNPRWIDKLISICKLVKVKPRENDEIEFIIHHWNKGDIVRYYTVKNHKLKRIETIRPDKEYKKISGVRISRPGYFDYH
jgi:hypothetical protein